MNYPQVMTEVLVPLLGLSNQAMIHRTIISRVIFENYSKNRQDVLPVDIRVLGSHGSASVIGGLAPTSGRSEPNKMTDRWKELKQRRRRCAEVE
jgi:hypothetical protein